MVTLRTGERVRVIECGPPDTTDIVVCVHGWGCSVYSYRDVMPLLAEAGRRTIALDLRGNGLSDKPETRELYTIDALARHVDEICEQLGVRRAIFLGHSMGSGILARVAAVYPHRVAALVLTAPAGFKKTFNMYAAIAATPNIITPILPTLVTRPLIATVINMAFGNPDLVTERDIDEYWAPSQFPAFSKTCRTSLHTFDWTAGKSGKFAGITAPLTVMYGMKDTLVPPDAALEYRTVVSDATCIPLDGCGHAVPDEAPNKVAQAVLAIRETR